MMKFRAMRPLLRLVPVTILLSGLSTAIFAPISAQAAPPQAPLLQFTPQRILHIAGSPFSGQYGDGGQAINARLQNPWGLAADASGNLYVADREHNTVRRVDAVTGIITTVAGLAPTSGGAGPLLKVPGAGGLKGIHGHFTLATSIPLNDPQSVAVDAAGNIYIASTEDNVVYKVDPAGEIVSYAGQQGTSGYGGDGGAANAALLYEPTGLSVDSSGNLYIADSSNYVVRRVDAITGNISTVAGSQAIGGNYSGDGGIATAASLSGPQGTAVDAAGNLYISDTFNNVIRKVDAVTGHISTVAGTGDSGFSGDGGPALSALLSNPYQIALDALGELYIADNSNSVVRKVDAAGVITTVAGSASSNGSTSDYDDAGAPATSVYFGNAAGVAVGATGTLYVSSNDQNIILQVDATGGAMAFGEQAVHTTATQILKLTNPSTSSVHFSGVLIDGAGFAVDSSGAGACNLASELAPGANCTLSVSFTPTSGSGYSAQLQLTDDAVGSPQIVYLSGYGILPPANVSLVVSPPSVPVGGTVTFTLAVTPSSGTTPVPTGSAELIETHSGTTYATLTLDANGNATLSTSTLPAGNFDFYIDYLGDSNYAESNSGDGFLTVVPKTVSIALQASASSMNLGDSVTLTANLTSTDTLTGNADFHSDGVNIGSSPIGGSGVAVLTTVIPAGTHVLQARYNNQEFVGGVSKGVSITVHSAVLQFQPSALYTIAGVPSDDLHGSFAGDGGPATQA
ncbi:MAG: Ig-like domain repeat protein, partial [Bryocella sp.]